MPLASTYGVTPRTAFEVAPCRSPRHCPDLHVVVGSLTQPVDEEALRGSCSVRNGVPWPPTLLNLPLAILPSISVFGIARPFQCKLPATPVATVVSATDTDEGTGSLHSGRGDDSFPSCSLPSKPRSSATVDAFDVSTATRVKGGWAHGLATGMCSTPSNDRWSRRLLGVLSMDAEGGSFSF